MRSVVVDRFDMAARVRSFCRTHPTTDPAYAKIFGGFEGLLTRGEAAADRQRNAVELARNAQKRRAEIRRVVHFQLLRHLITIGEITAKSRSELVDRFKLPPTRARNRVFLAAVRSMVTLAEQHLEALVNDGMSPLLLEQLKAMLDEFEAASEAARVARLDAIGATGELEEISSELMESVRALDGYMRMRFGKDPKLLYDWNAAKHLPVRSTPAPPTSGQGEDPASSSGAAPAK